MTNERQPWDVEIPVIRPEHLVDARLYADRTHMINNLGPEKLAVVAELGVAVGDFSQVLIERYNPDVFYAIDLYTLHEYKTIWNQDTSTILGGKTHLNAYLQRMHQFRERISILLGDGASELAKLPDASIDLIYVDGSHEFADVVRDCAVARTKVKPGGFLVFNDYVVWSHFESKWYGVVPVVNDLVVNNGGKIVGFALHPNMYADIAIQM